MSKTGSLFLSEPASFQGLGLFWSRTGLSCALGGGGVELGAPKPLQHPERVHPAPLTLGTLSLDA